MSYFDLDEDGHISLNEFIRGVRVRKDSRPGCGRSGGAWLELSGVMPSSMGPSRVP